MNKISPRIALTAAASVPSPAAKWTVSQVEALYQLPLISIKTGGCSEDCSDCSQSARYQTEVGRGALMSVEELLAAAREAKAKGASRFCIAS